MYCHGKVEGIQDCDSHRYFLEFCLKCVKAEMEIESNDQPVIFVHIYLLI